MKTQNFTKHLLSAILIGIISLSLHLYFFDSKGYFIGTGTDASLQFLYFKYFLHHMFQEGHFFWSWNYGLGGDILGQYSYYYTGSILFWISMLFRMETLQDVLNYSLLFGIVRMFLAMFFMYLLMQYHKRSLMASIIAAICYGGSTNFAFYSVFFDYMAEGFVWLPLLIFGYDRFVDQKKSGLFVFSVVIVVVSNFYFAFISSVFLNMYAVFRYFTYKTSFSIKGFLHHYFSMVRYYLFGLFLSSFMFFPALYAFLHTNRFFSEVEIPLWFPFDEYKTLYKNLLFPLEFPTNDFSKFSLILPIGCILFILVGFTIKQWKTHKFFMLFMLFLLFLPFTYSFFNGLSSIQYRWHYLFQFTLAYVAGFFIDSIFSRNLKKGQMVFLLFITLGFAFLLKEKHELLNSYVNNKDTYHMIFVSSVAFLILLKNHLNKWIIFTILFMGFTANATLNNYQMYTIQLGPYGKMKYDQEHYFSQSSFENKEDLEVVRFIKKNDQGFYRMIWGGQKLEHNTPLYYGYKGFSAYNSLLSKNIQQFFMDQYNTLQIDAPSFFRDVDNRRYIETALGNKYYVVLKETASFFVPYGYEKVWETKKYNVYRNIHFLSPGFVYTTGIAKRDFMGLNTGEKDQLLLNAVVVEDPKRLGLSLFNTNSLEVSTLFSGTNNLDLSNIQKGKNLFIVAKNGEIKIPIKRPQNQGEILVELTIKNTLGERYEMKVEGKSFLKNPESYIYSYPKQTFTFNLGNFQKDSIEVKLTPGMYQIEKINVLFNSYAPFPALVENVKKKSMYNILYSEESVKGEVNSEEDGLLFMSFPYSPGWKVKVDGKKVKTEEVNHAFIGILVQKGHHFIELKYMTPLFIPGIVISVIAGLGYLLYEFRYKLFGSLYIERERRNSRIRMIK